MLYFVELLKKLQQTPKKEEKMNNLAKELYKRRILKQSDVFILNRLLSEMEVIPHANVIDLIKMYSTSNEKEIEEMYLVKRKRILAQKDGSFKEKLCIYCDSILNEYKGESKEFLRLIVTIVARHSYRVIKL